MIERKRLDNWPSRLDAAISSHVGYEFSYGFHDCALFTADCIKAIIGVDLAVGLRGNYFTLEDSKVLLAANGYASHVDILAKNFEELEHYSQAITGDACVVETEMGTLATSIFSAPHIIAFDLPGLIVLPMEKAIRSFKVEMR